MLYGIFISMELLKTNKAIDITISILKKEYPFIVGYEFVSSTSDYFLYLTLICDVNKVSEFYKSDIRSYFLRNNDMLYNKEFAYPFSVLEISEELNSDDKFSLFYELKDSFNDIYEFIPNEYKIMNLRFNDPMDVELDKFKFVK